MEEAWKALESCAASVAKTSMREMFESDPARAERYSIEAAGLFLDYSKNKIDDNIVDHLIALANAADLESARSRMAAGERINATENRAVLHIALRDFSQRAYHLDGEDVALKARVERERMKAFCDKAHSGALKGFTGEPLDTVVNIGIGGSDLGPQMAVEALRPYWLEGRRAYFVSNVDGQHLADTLDIIDPKRTLFVIASKTFTTDETLTNATSAKEWFLAQGGGEADIAKHFIALSTNESAVGAFGIDTDNMFRFWDWVGGRFSLWSAVGLSIALQVGFQNFENMLRGAHSMDEHFRTSPLRENMPVMLALMGLWNRNVLGASAHAVLPYDQHLWRLAAYLQQAEMESNGKRVSIDGKALDRASAPVIFGEPGTNGQHAFYQLLHQGTDIVPADFIAAAVSQSELGAHHGKLLANFLAQPEALMWGRTLEEARAALKAQGLSKIEIDRLSPHKVFPGDRPTNAILMERLTPQTLGALIALYEHKIFCQGVLWGVNSFDQWGVELGKTLAKKIHPEIAALGGAVPSGSKDSLGEHDASTAGLIARINAMRGKFED